MTDSYSLSLSDLETELSFVATRVAEAAERVQRGERMDLSPLIQAVDRLCNGLLKLSSPDAQRLAERLPGIIQTLDDLTASLEAKEPQQAALDSRVSHQRATQAYDKRQPRVRKRG